MFQRSFFVSIFFSALMVLGACASKSTEVTAATDEAGHQCTADCKHDANHGCTAQCSHDKNHKCTDHKCSSQCKKGETAATEGECAVHANHTHKHGKACGHKTIKHDDHADFIHDGHQHHIHGTHVDEHKQLKAAATSKDSNS